MNLASWRVTCSLNGLRDLLSLWCVSFGPAVDCGTVVEEVRSLPAAFLLVDFFLNGFQLLFGLSDGGVSFGLDFEAAVPDGMDRGVPMSPAADSFHQWTRLPLKTCLGSRRDGRSSRHTGGFQ